MTDRAKEFLKKASQDKALGAKLEGLKIEKDPEKTIAGAVRIAREAGYELSPEDFSLQEGRMTDEEIVDVAGGWQTCVCVMGGGGKADEDGTACVCVLYGFGMRRDDTKKTRCECINGGFGKNWND